VSLQDQIGYYVECIEEELKYINVAVAGLQAKIGRHQNLSAVTSNNNNSNYAAAGEGPQSLYVGESGQRVYENALSYPSEVYALHFEAMERNPLLDESDNSDHVRYEGFLLSFLCFSFFLFLYLSSSSLLICSDFSDSSLSSWTDSFLEEGIYLFLCVD
jgi:hypothetical protein